MQGLLAEIQGLLAENQDQLAELKGQLANIQGMHKKVLDRACRADPRLLMALRP
ncbi:hypothetical protein KBZ19_12065 [Synechococcus sp. L2F]|nr:hypothetical protein [Synechococcus sp. L2F]